MEESSGKVEIRMYSGTRALAECQTHSDAADLNAALTQPTTLVAPNVVQHKVDTPSSTNKV